MSVHIDPLAVVRGDVMLLGDLVCVADSDSHVQLPNKYDKRGGVWADLRGLGFTRVDGRDVELLHRQRATEPQAVAS